MPQKQKISVQTLPEIPSDWFNQLSSQIKTEHDLSSFMAQFMKQLVERSLKAELSEHLGTERIHAEASNSRNGYMSKTLKGSFGELSIQTPRDRKGTFEPILVRKGQTRFSAFDDQIIALYARGMSTRDIADMFMQLYGAEVSHSLISKVTEAVLDEVNIWRNRPLDEVYPIVYLDCIHIKVQDSKHVASKAVYVALGVNMDGKKELLGLWMSDNEGAKFWLAVLTELQNRGIQDIFIACVDGLTGFPDAISVAYPRTKVQLCIVHMVRNSLRYVSDKDMKLVAADLKSIYHAPSSDAALIALEDFALKWDDKYSRIAQTWRNHWANLCTFFDYPDEIRRAIYTTNAIESLNSVIRKAVKNRKIFPNDNAVYKVIYLAMLQASQKWTMPIRNWKPVLNRFSIELGDRVPPLS